MADLTVSNATDALLARTAYDHAGSDETTLLVNTTNPGSGSLLADFQVDNTTKFSVDSEGLAFGDGFYCDTSRTSWAAPVAGYSGILGAFGSLGIFRGSLVASISSTQMNFDSNVRLSFGNDASIHRDAANTLAQRNSTNAQEFRLYGTYADASNYERLSIGTDESGNSVISTEYAGTGTARELHFISGGGIIMSADHNSTDATTFAVNTTNPGSGSLLADFQAGGSSVTKILPSGCIISSQNAGVGPMLQAEISGGYRVGVYAHQYRFEVGISQTEGGASSAIWGNLRYDVNAKQLTLGDGSSASAGLSVDGSNTLAMLNPSSEFRLYGTYTSASDYERGFMRFDGSGNLEIGHEAAGTGTARSVFLTSSGATALNASSTSGNVALNIAGGARFRAWNTFTQSLVPLYISASSTDPNDPSSNQFVIWQSDGTASGDDGDIMLKITDSGGTTKTIALIQPIQIPALAGNPTSSNGATVTSSNGEASGMSFPDTGDTSVVYSVVVPSGSAGTFSVELRGDSSATASASEEWAVSIEAKQDDEAAYGTPIAAEVTITAASTPHTITSGTITPSGSPTSGDIVYIKITRDVSEESTSSDGGVLLREIIVTFN